MSKSPTTYKTVKPYSKRGIEKMVDEFNRGTLSYYKTNQARELKIIRAVPLKSSGRGRPKYEYELDHDVIKCLLS